MEGVREEETILPQERRLGVLAPGRYFSIGISVMMGLVILKLGHPRLEDRAAVEALRLVTAATAASRAFAPAVKTRLHRNARYRACRSAG